MKSKHILLFSLIFTFLHVYSQNSFEHTFFDDEHSVPFEVLEDSDGNYLILGRKTEIMNTTPNSYILKIGNNGTLLQDTIYSFSNAFGEVLFNVKEIDNNYYVFGGRAINDTVSFLMFRIRDKSLNILSEKFLKFPKKRSGSWTNTILDSDNNFVISGTVMTLDSFGFYLEAPYFYKLSFEGDSLTSRFFEAGHAPANDIMESDDHQYYYSFTEYGNINYQGENIMVLSKDFDSITSYHIDNITHYSSAVRMNDTTILMAGMYQEDKFTDRFTALTLNMNSSFEKIDSKIFAKDPYTMHEYPSVARTVSKNGENIYIGATSNISYSTPLSPLDSWFHLIKVDEAFNVIWEKWYGGDAYYMIISLCATNDGGCIMVGSRFDDETQIDEKDIYVVKVDADGIVTWEKEIPIPTQNALVFPNPGKEKLILKTTLLETEFLLSDLQGKSILQQTIKEETTEINTQNLTSGTYLWTLKKEAKVVESGKWVKE